MRFFLFSILATCLASNAQASPDDLAISSAPHPTKSKTEAALPVLVKFTGPDCIPCARLTPKLKAATPRGMKVWEFSNDNPAHAYWFRQWRVERVPTAFLMTPDGRTLASLHGDATPAQIAAFFAVGVETFTRFCPGRACGGPSTCPSGGECISCLSCAGAKAAPRPPAPPLESRGYSVPWLQATGCPSCQ